MHYQLGGRTKIDHRFINALVYMQSQIRRIMESHNSQSGGNAAQKIMIHAIAGLLLYLAVEYGPTMAHKLLTVTWPS